MKDAPIYPITQPMRPLYHASYVGGGSLSAALTVTGDRTTIMTTGTLQEGTHDPDQHQDADPAREDGRVAGAG
jgi:hypothetical protein